MNRIKPAEITLGQPLAFDIVAEDGRLLLSKGQIVSLENHRLHFIETAFKIGDKARQSAAYLPVFVRMERLAFRLATIEEDIVNGAHLDGWAARVRAITADLIEANDDDPDAAFAAMHLEARYKYDVVHHLMAAILCARLGRAAGLTKDERFSLVAAAMTHDLAVLAMRREIESSEILTPDQHQHIKEHPALGVKMLQELGITDELWLKSVLEHHEFLDGSGYAGLSAEHLQMPSRIICLADAMSAMLRPRPYRERKLAKAALADLYDDPQGKYDKALIATLVRELGLFPPGSVLRLANRETAIAVRTKPENPAVPEVVAVTDYAGHPLEKPSQRDITRPETTIADLLDTDKIAKVRRLLPACWKKP